MLVLRLEDIYREQAKENQRLSEGRGQKGCQNSDNLNEVDTRKELAQIAKVGQKTIAISFTFAELFNFFHFSPNIIILPLYYRL